MTEKDSISLDDIDSAPTEDIETSGSGVKEERFLAHERESFKKELGWLGMPFGGRTEKPGNISALVILFCFVGIFVVYGHPPTKDSGVTLERVFGGFTSIITLVLGYLFGSNDRASK